MRVLNDLSELRKTAKKTGMKLDLRNLVAVYRVFGRHYRKYWKMLTVAGLSMAATIGVVVLQPWPLKLVLDHLILSKPLPESFSFLGSGLESNPKQLLLILASAILGIAILHAVFSYINKFLVSSTGAKIIADIRERVFDHLQRLSLSFHESSHSGDLVYLLTADMKELKEILISFPQDFVFRVLTLITYVALMLFLDWRLALIALSTAPLLYFFTRFFGMGMKKAMKKKRKKEGAVSSLVAENVSSMALIQAYGREQEELDRFSQQVKGSLDAELSALRLQRTFSRLADFLVTMATAAVLYFGGLYALGGAILPGTLVVFVAYMREIYGIIEKFSEMILGLAKAMVSGERLLQLVENEMVMQDKPGAVAAPLFAGKIEFRNVTFAYKEDKDVLKDVSFVAEVGQRIALVGHSGAGKSTLISLLLRFYDPQEGSILIDGQDIRKITLKSLRDQLTILLQDAKLFRESVRENIRFGERDATDAEIVEAAKQAEAHEFIMELPDGYDTLMDEGGENLSGGQKQRINIARAIVRNTPILLLDEPITGLDARSEAKINAAIERLTKGKTTFIIAHKLSTIVNADKILFLENGAITDQGAHEELMRTSSRYREMYKLQFDGTLESEAPSVVTENESSEPVKSKAVTDQSERATA